MNPEKLAKLQASVRTGGKGSVRRKKKAVHKTTTTDDKRLQNTLKRLSVNNIPAIEEVNLFKDNGTVIHFSNPKVRNAGPAQATLPRDQLWRVFRFARSDLYTPDFIADARSWHTCRPE